MNTKKVIIIGVILLVMLSVTALIIPVAITTKNQINKDAITIIKSDGKNNAFKIGDIISTQFTIAKHLVSTVEEFWNKRGDDYKYRDIADLTEAYLSNDPKMSTAGYWISVETDKLDSKELSKYLKKDQKMQDVISCYSFREGTKNTQTNILVATPTDPWYSAPYKSQKSYITDPYVWEKAYIVSFAIPLIVDGKVIGVGGADIDITNLNEIIKNINYNGAGHARLISDNFLIVSDGKDPKLSGTSLAGDSQTQETMKTIQSGSIVESYITDNESGEKFYQVSFPIEIVGSGLYWILELTLPESVIQDEVNAALYIVIITAVIVLLIGVVVAILFSIFVGRAIDSRDHWYRQILDTITSPLSVVNMDKKLQYINKAAREALKVDENSYIGKDCGQTWNIENCDKSSNSCPLNNMLNTGVKLSKTKMFGKSWDIHTDYIIDIKDNKIGMIEFFSDVTDREKISEIVDKISSMIENVQNSSKQISSASESLSQGATEQAASLEEITSSLSHSTSQITTNATNASEANNLANKAHTMAKTGYEKMEVLEKSMRSITENAELTRKVIKTIDDIAFQTNLLALNAAVEAARAGTHGKGFAVVAEEVRNLAARSAKAAQETAELIDKSNNEITNGAKLSKDTAESLSEIATESAKVESLISEIATASQEQSEGIMQINIGLEQISNVTSHNTATSEETASATAELNRQISDLAAILGNNQTSNASSPKKAPKTKKKIINSTPTPSSSQEWGGKIIKPTDEIKLDDSEFGKF